MKSRIFTPAGTMVCLFLSLVLFSITLQAQTPASNIGGPLKAYAGGATITLTSSIASSVQNPTISYSFDHNSSGASIVSQGPFIYNRATGAGTQTVTVNPGSNKGSFIIKLDVTTPNGICESSKSVTVVGTRGSGGGAGNDASN